MNITKSILIFTSVFLLNSCKNNPSEEQKNIATKVTTTIATSHEITRFHNVPAVLKAQNRADLSFQLSGTIKSINVKIGDSVEKDDELIHLYNPNIDPALAANEAKLESILTQIRQVEKDLENLKTLRKNNSVSKTTYEHKETELKNLLAQQKSVESEMTLSQANQQETIIKAPFTGVISQFSKQPGEFVSAGQPVISIYQNKILEVETEITKELWSNLKLGDVIEGYLGDEKLEFELVELAQSANPLTHLLPVVLQLKNSLPEAIGQNVNLSFPQKYQNVYQLPLQTVIDDGINQPYVFVTERKKAQKHIIKPLFINGNDIIFEVDNVIDNPVIIEGQSKVASGTPIEE